MQIFFAFKKDEQTFIREITEKGELLPERRISIPDEAEVPDIEETGFSALGFFIDRDGTGAHVCLCGMMKAFNEDDPRETTDSFFDAVRSDPKTLRQMHADISAMIQQHMVVHN